MYTCTALMDTLAPESVLSGVAVDVVLLGVVIALHVTQRDQNLKLLLVFLITVHVITTTRHCGGGDGDSAPMEQLQNTADSQPLESVGSKATSVSTEKIRKNASDAEYSRQFSSPVQLRKTHDVLPTTSKAANSKLVDSRTGFYKDLV